MRLAGCVITDSDGNILLVHRSTPKRTQWEIPGGKLEAISGAVITKIDGQPIDSADALVAAVRSKAPGDNVTLTYTDGSGAPQTVQVTLGQAQT